MRAGKPKQYLELHGRTVLEWSLDRLQGHPLVAGTVVALAPDDPYWPTLAPRHAKPVWTAAGGSERCRSVLNALEVLRTHAQARDWVLVHDAARPCLRPADLAHLIDTLRSHAVGGLLAVPVRDTMKRADAEGAVRETVDRQGLWHALTPQMFRLDALHEALRAAIARGVDVTDEASAMEFAGARPLLVEGHADNIKITRPEDLALAEFYLERQIIDQAGAESSPPSPGEG